MSLLADVLARIVVLFRWERPGPDAGRIGFSDADVFVHHLRRDPAAGGQAQRTRVGAGHVGERAVVEVEQRALSTLEQDGLAVLDGRMEHLRGVGHERREPLCILPAILNDRIDGHRLGSVEGREELVFVLDNSPEFLLQLRQIAKIAHPHGVAPPDLVRKAWADTANRGADLLLAERFLSQLVFPLVVVQDDVGVLADEQPAVQTDATIRQAVDLADQYGRVHHDRVGDHADSALPDRAARKQVQREAAVPDHHRMTGVRAAAIPDDHIAALRQDIDHLAFAFIAPL